MKMTPENFAPILSKAITDAFALNPQDPHAGYKAMISGLMVFHDEILKDVGAVSSKEPSLPGFVLIVSAISAFVASDYRLAQESLDRYLEAHPGGVFAKAITGEKAFEVMTIDVQPMTVMTFCRQCCQEREFELDGQVGTCTECQWQIRFVNR